MRNGTPDKINNNIDEVGKISNGKRNIQKKVGI